MMILKGCSCLKFEWNCVHGQHLKDTTTISCQGCDSKLYTIWNVDCCDQTMIWITPYNQDHPTTHVIVVVVFNRNILQELDVHNGGCWSTTVSLYIGGCIRVLAQRKAFIIFQNNWDCGLSIGDDESVTCF